MQFVKCFMYTVTCNAKDNSLNRGTVVLYVSIEMQKKKKNTMPCLK